MAESTNQEEAVAKGWILDFVCDAAWRAFLRRDEDFDNSRDFLQRLLSGSVESTPERQTRVKLVQLLCRLMDGQDWATRYDDEDITPLESAVPLFDALVENTQTQHDKLEEMRMLVKLHAVLVCCVGDDFDAAEEVFTRVWAAESQSAKEKKLRPKVRDVIRSGNPQHSLIQTFPYDKFLQAMAKFLQPIVDDFIEPFLLRAARKVILSRTEDTQGTATETDVSKTPSKIEEHLEDDYAFQSADLLNRTEDTQGTATETDVSKTPSKIEEHLEDEYAFQSADLLKECFMVIADEEGLSIEWEDVVEYDCSNFHIPQSQATKMSEPTVRRSPRKTSQTEKKAGPTVRRSPRKKTQTETVEPSTTQGKRKPRDSWDDSDGTEADVTLQASTSTGKANPAKRRVLQQEDASSSESEDNAEKKSPDKRPKTSKKRREINGYGKMSDEGEKEVWSSEDETFSRPVRMKRPRIDSDSSCSSGDLRPALSSSCLPPVPKLPAHLKPKPTPKKKVTRMDFTTKGFIRQRYPWTDVEVQFLIDGIKRYGAGNWKDIRDNYRFNGRSNVNLKDKWRQLVQAGAVSDQ